MCPAEWYRHTDFADMVDDWGFVFFPKGPGPNAKMQTMYLTNPRVMPLIWIPTVPTLLHSHTVNG